MSFTIGKFGLRLKSKSISLDVSLAKTLAATKFVLLMVIKLLTSSAEDVGWNIENNEYLSFSFHLISK